jgi:steroid delta-isomerase-like uncharacterized protein
MLASASPDVSHLLHALVDAMGSNSADAVAALYTEDCLIADPLMEVSGREGLRDACAEFLAAFRIDSIEINEVIEQLPHLAVRWSWSVTHQGEYLGVPASGKHFDTWNIMFLEVRDGLICRDLSVWDAGELRRLERLASDGANLIS